MPDWNEQTSDVTFYLEPDETPTSCVAYWSEGNKHLLRLVLLAFGGPADPPGL